MTHIFDDNTPSDDFENHFQDVDPNHQDHFQDHSALPDPHLDPFHSPLDTQDLKHSSWEHPTDMLHSENPGNFDPLDPTLQNHHHDSLVDHPSNWTDPLPEFSNPLEPDHQGHDAISEQSYSPPDIHHPPWDIQEPDPNHHTANPSRHITMASSRDHHGGPYTTVSDTGSIYKHTSEDDSSGSYVGRIQDRSVYNSYGTRLGHVDLKGNIYDSHDKKVGWVDSQGHVYNQADVQVYETTRGLAGGAAYMLFVYLGGVT